MLLHNQIILNSFFFSGIMLNVVVPEFCIVYILYIILCADTCEK